MQWRKRDGTTRVFSDLDIVVVDRPPGEAPLLRESGLIRLPKESGHGRQQRHFAGFASMEP